MVTAIAPTEPPPGDKDAIIRTIIGLILPNYPIDEDVAQDVQVLDAEAV